MVPSDSKEEILFVGLKIIQNNIVQRKKDAESEYMSLNKERKRKLSVVMHSRCNMMHWDA